MHQKTKVCVVRVVKICTKSQQSFNHSCFVGKCRQPQLYHTTNGSIAVDVNYNRVLGVRAGGGAALHEEHLPTAVLWLGAAKVAATQGVLRHGSNQVMMLMNDEKQNPTAFESTKKRSY